VGLEFEETTGEGNRGRMMGTDNLPGQLPIARTSSRVLILNQNSAACAADKCDALSGLLQGSLSVSCLQKPCYNHFPTRVSSAPDLILVRPSVDLAGSELIESCKQKWHRAAILALLCPRWGQPLGEFSCLLRSVDDFLSCPFQEAELFFRVERLLRINGKASASLNLQSVREKLRLESLVGDSELFIKAIEKILPLARSNAPALILGETGTGKELFARALHYQGARHGKPFVPVNCGGVPDHLFENELFGHAKGAYTDATSQQNGLISEAEGGTLFLDEIDTLSPSSQVKLLRFLQDGEYRPLGSGRSVKSNVRVIAASNADVRAKVEKQMFRADLYHRLNVLSLCVPALRERLSDIPLLARYFIERYSKQYGEEPVHLSTAAMQKLLSYSWPGNVRELEAVIQRGLVLSSRSVLQPEDIDIAVPYRLESAGPKSLRQAKSTAMGDFERNYLATLLATYRGNISHAAKAAGKDRRTLQRLLRKYNIDRDAFH
jgi:DNA-binding NtrC family response regulator